MNEKFLNSERTSELWSKVKEYVEGHGGDGGGTVNWSDINGRPDLSTVSSMVVAPISLLKLSWNANKQQTVPIEGILADEDAQLIIPMPKSEAYNTAGVECVAQAGGTLTFRAKTVPTEDLPVNVYVFGAAEVKEEYVGTFEWWSPQMTSNNTPEPYVASASGEYQSQGGYGKFYAYLAFTDVASSKGAESWHTPSSQVGAYITFDFGEKTLVSGIRMMPSYLTYTMPPTIPKQFNVLGSDDGDTWDVLYSANGTENYDPSSHEWRECIFDKPKSYRYFRVITTGPNYSANDPCWVSIAQIEFSVPQKGGAQ